MYIPKVSPTMELNMGNLIRACWLEELPVIRKEFFNFAIFQGEIHRESNRSINVIILFVKFKI